jgi:hypothetical protein
VAFERLAEPPGRNVQELHGLVAAAGRQGPAVGAEPHGADVAVVSSARAPSVPRLQVQELDRAVVVPEGEDPVVPAQVGRVDPRRPGMRDAAQELEGGRGVHEHLGVVHDHQPLAVVGGDQNVGAMRGDKLRARAHAAAAHVPAGEVRRALAEAGTLVVNGEHEQRTLVLGELDPGHRLALGAP